MQLYNKGFGAEFIASPLSIPAFDLTAMWYGVDDLTAMWYGVDEMTAMWYGVDDLTTLW